MNRGKKALLLSLFLGMNYLHSFANMSGRGRIDSGGPSDSAVVILGIIAIVIGGFLAFTLLGASSQDEFKDKELNKMGCAGIAAIIIGITLLVGMCSH